MGGACSQKLLPRRRFSVSSGAQLLPAYRKPILYLKGLRLVNLAPGAAVGRQGFIQLGTRLPRLSYRLHGKFWQAGVGNSSQAPKVCVQTDDKLQFDPCLWDRHANYFEFPATQNVNLPAVRVETGHLLSITVADSKLYLSARDFNQPRSPLSEEVKVSLRSPVLGFIPIRPKSQGQNRVFEYVIPFNKPVPLNIHAPGLQLKDSASGKQTVRFSQVIRIEKNAPKNFNFSLEKGN